jgi:hypothetical protein
MGRYGPMVQIGHQDEEEKPRFAKLSANQSIETHLAQRHEQPMVLRSKLLTTAPITHGRELLHQAD